MPSFHKNFKQKISLLAILYLFLTTPALLFAMQWQNVNFPDTYEEQGAKLELRCTKLHTVFFMKTFIAGFYLPKGVTGSQAESDVPKRIEVSYFIHVSGRRLFDCTVAKMRENLKPAEFARLKNRFPVLERYFIDIKPGDRYALSYTPGTATKFIYNNRLVGTMEGADLAKALFSVWMGPHPVDSGLKEKVFKTH